MSSENTAQKIAKRLKKIGINVAFTVPGSSCISLNQELHKEKIDLILCKSEEAACHAAHGVAAVNEGFGCAVVSRGPGATNTITGLVTACEGFPILVIVGDNASNTRQKGIATQDLNLEEIFTGVCNFNVVKNLENLENILDQVVEGLSNSRQSQVLIIPSDFFDLIPPEHITYEKKTTTMEKVSDLYTKNEVSREKLLADLDRYQNVLILGKGILDNKALRRTALKILKQHPETRFLSSTQGLRHPLNQRSYWFGTMGELEGNRLLYQAEHIVVIGERLDTSMTGLPEYLSSGRKITSVVINSLPQNSLQTDNEFAIEEQDFAGLFEEVLQRGNFTISDQEKSSSDTSYPVKVLKKILNLLPKKTIICLDSGQNFFWAMQALVKENRHRAVYSYAQATLGFGLPSLIGVSASYKEGSLLICGDAGFIMRSEELETITTNNLPAKVIILNNQGLGMIRQTQRLKGMEHLATEIRIRDLKKICEGYGITYFRLDTIEQDQIIKDFLKSTIPAVLDIQISATEELYPRGSAKEKLPLI